MGSASAVIPWSLVPAHITLTPTALVWLSLTTLCRLGPPLGVRQLFPATLLSSVLDCPSLPAVVTSRVWTQVFYWAVSAVSRTNNAIEFRREIEVARSAAPPRGHSRLATWRVSVSF